MTREADLTKFSKLAEIFGFSIIGDSAVELSGVAQSANQVRPGDLFVALSGAKHHGIDFLQQAISNGAVALLTDQAGLEKIEAASLPYAVVSEPRVVLGRICAEVFDISGLRLFAVTGTNGKTSTATFLSWLLNSVGISCGLSASTGRIIGSKSWPATLTTPEVSELFRLLADMKIAGNQAAAVEVSAQAIERHRIDGLKFEVSGFTNLSRDHLDDFGSMENYLATKQRLFSEFSLSSVINIEDQYGEQLANALPDALTLGESNADVRFQVSPGRPARLQISTDSNQTVCKVAAGPLMARNFALAFAIALKAGVDFSALAKVSEKVTTVIPGRLQRVSSSQPAVYVDYAHTPAGVKSAVSELLQTNENLTVVLGASGNRDQGKRSGMAEATAGASQLVITDQHPRDEDPALIRAALIESANKVLSPNQIHEIPDPEQAIAWAISHTPRDGAVLWCGPGHLDYREVSGQKLPFNAIEIARRLVEQS